MADVLVGRVDERSRIDGVLRRAAEGQPGVVLLIGEAGVGKTTLLRDAMRRAEEDGFAVAAGAAMPGASGLAFTPVRAAFRAARSALGPELVEDLVRRHPNSAVLFGAPGATAPEAIEPSELYVCFLDFVGDLTGERPLLLALEDLHWADRSTLDMLSFLVRNLRHERVVVLATVRSDDPDTDPYTTQSIAELARLPGVQRLDIPRLDRPELTALATEVLGAAPDGELLDELWRRSGGNPFFAVELLATDPAHGLPPSLREVVHRRLALLEDRHRRHTRAAAVAGTDVDPELLATFLERPVDEIEDAVRAAVDVEILIVDPLTGRLRFRHALLQEHAYAELLAGERRRLHERLALVLAEDPATPPAVLAYHLERAHRYDDALLPTLLAARQASGDHGTVDAVHHYRRAVELWARADDPAPAVDCTLVDILEEGVACAMNVGIGAVAGELVEILLEELDPLTDPERWVLHAAELNEIRWETGRAAEADAILERGRALLPDDAATPAAVRLHERCSYTALLRGDVETAAVEADTAVAAAQQLADTELEAIAVGRLGLLDVTRGSIDGLEELHRALALARSLGPGHEAARAAVNYIVVLHAAGDMAAATAAVEDLLGELDRIAVGPVDRAMLEILGARIDVASGRLERAGQRLARSIVPAALRYREYRVIADAEHAVAVGAFASARALLDALEPSDAILALVHRASVEAEVALRSGRLADAARIVDEYLPVALLIPEVTFLRLCAQGLEAAADDDAVIDRYRSMAEAKHAELVPNEIIDRRHLDALLWDVRNLHALRRHAPPHGGEQAATGFDAAGQALLAGWARVRHARAIIETGGDRTTAQVAVVEAHRWATDVGAHPLRLAAEDLARRARFDLPGQGRSGGDGLGLTDREAEVLRLVAEGHTNREIADELYISPKTASVHVSNILRKVGAANRAEAAVIAHRHGLDLVG